MASMPKSLGIKTSTHTHQWCPLRPPAPLSFYGSEYRTETICGVGCPPLSSSGCESMSPRARDTPPVAGWWSAISPVLLHSTLSQPATGTVQQNPPYRTTVATGGMPLARRSAILAGASCPMIGLGIHAKPQNTPLGVSLGLRTPNGGRPAPLNSEERPQWPLRGATGTMLETGDPDGLRRLSRRCLCPLGVRYEVH